MSTTTMKFKNQHTLEQRKQEAERIRTKYPDRIPVICEKAAKSKVQVCEEKDPCDVDEFC